MLIKWKLASKFDELPGIAMPDRMKIEALVAIAEQLAGIKEELEKLNKELVKGIQVNANVHPY